jgi:pyridoxamine 5'-phosphate oxidase
MDETLFEGDEPLGIAQRWLAEAWATEPADANAASLATVDAGGLPNVRVVLVKALGPGGFTFYTNYESAKGQEIAARPKAALVLHWKSLRRQVRVRGPVVRVEEAEADAYYASRPLDSRIGAWVSAQSRPLASRETLLEAVARKREELGEDPPRPPYWGGFRVIPLEMELWADGAFRLHDRFRWTRPAEGEEWQVDRLSP